jgi:hypothetical protein
MSVSRQVLSVPRQRHATSTPCQCHATCTPVLSKLHNSAVAEGSLHFRPLPRPSSVFSLFLCLCITWTILRSSSCINSGLVSLPVPHLSLFWLWAQVSLHLYIVRDLLTSGSGHRSASAQVAFDISLCSSLVRCTSARDIRLRSPKPPRVHSRRGSSPFPHCSRRAKRVPARFA